MWHEDGMALPACQEEPCREDPAASLPADFRRGGTGRLTLFMQQHPPAAPTWRIQPRTRSSSRLAYLGKHGSCGSIFTTSARLAWRTTASLCISGEWRPLHRLLGLGYVWIRLNTRGKSHPRHSLATHPPLNILLFIFYIYFIRECRGCIMRFTCCFSAGFFQNGMRFRPERRATLQIGKGPRQQPFRHTSRRA